MLMKIRNHYGKIICYANPENGDVEIKFKDLKQKGNLFPGQKMCFEYDDGYKTIVEYEGPNGMFYNTYKSI